MFIHPCSKRQGSILAASPIIDRTPVFKTSSRFGLSRFRDSRRTLGSYFMCLLLLGIMIHHS
ncbi:hypothetical protein BDW68DRAFT_159022 [Aspergillus falconensis]